MEIYNLANVFAHGYGMIPDSPEEFAEMMRMYKTQCDATWVSGGDLEDPSADGGTYRAGRHWRMGTYDGKMYYGTLEATDVHFSELEKIDFDLDSFLATMTANRDEYIRCSTKEEAQLLIIACMLINKIQGINIHWSGQDHLRFENTLWDNDAAKYGRRYRIFTEGTCFYLKRESCSIIHANIIEHNIKEFYTDASATYFTLDMQKATAANNVVEIDKPELFPEFVNAAQKEGYMPITYSEAFKQNKQNYCVRLTYAAQYGKRIVTYGLTTNYKHKGHNIIPMSEVLVEKHRKTFDLSKPKQDIPTLMADFNLMPRNICTAKIATERFPQINTGSIEILCIAEDGSDLQFIVLPEMEYYNYSETTTFQITSIQK